MSTTACPTCGGNVDAETGVCPQCTTQVASRAASATATATATEGYLAPAPSETPAISGYRIIGRLGEGGMGAVYLAEETTLGRRVAVKVISTRVAPDAQSKARFLREARTLATIEHPHVVRVYSFGEVEGKPYLAMEYVEGETLTERITRLGALPLDAALRITRDVVDALDAAWDSHVIHRDIKPSNILIDRRNRVRVADFGLAKPKDSGEADVALTQSGLMVGTPHYISPEQAQGKEVDFRSDFYSLGIMLFHMLTGERPFQGSTPVAIVARHLHEPMPLLRARRADLPAEVERLILWMTAKDPAERPSSHRELLAALDALITRTPTSPMPTFSTIAIVQPPRRPVRNVAVAIAAILLIATAAALYLWRRRANDMGPATFTPPRAGFTVAVAPFYGPDEDSAKEGRVMAALIERAVAERLHGENARVAGIEETKTAVRSHDEARELGTKLNASAVIWGEAFALRTETEIRPYVTVVTQPKVEAQPSKAQTADERLLADSRAMAVENLADTRGTPVKLEAEAPNQIELRKTSASGIGDVVVLLAGLHALENNHHDKALAFFRQLPQSAETLRYEVQALLRANKRDEARAVLEKSLVLDPGHAASQALLGDLSLAQNRIADAVAAYQRAAATGQSFSTMRGILYDGRLYVRETYQHELLNSGEETNSLYLLAIDPATGRVVARYSLPGLITSLRTDGDELVIAYDGGRENHPLPEEVRFRQGSFDRPLWSPPNLLWRVRSMKAGRVLPGNFLSEIDRVRTFGEPGGSFRLANEPAPGIPATLPELERALRAAIDRDPTQPWHHFFLAVTLRAQKRTAEANAVLDGLIRRDWPGVPYYQFTWMLANLERMRYSDWAERLYPKALAMRRQVPQPVLFSTLIERLINAPFVRQAASNRDLARGHDVLLRARELGGVTPEGEDLVAAAWAKHFERTGQPAKAAQERQVKAAVNEHPFNYLGVMAKVDYTAAFAAGTLLAFALLVIIIASDAIGRARRLDFPPRAPSTPRSARLARLAGPARAAILGIVRGALLLAALWLAAFEMLVPAVIALAAAVAIVMVVRRLHVTPSQVLSATTRNERLALLAGYILFIVSAAVFFNRLIDTQILAATPIGIGDALGHPRVIQMFEERQPEGERSDALEYVLAVANHYAGERTRAEALYGAVPSDFAHAKENLAALKAGIMPVVPLSAQELAAGLTIPRLDVLAEIITKGEMMFALVMAGAVVVVPLILLAFFAVPRRELPPDVPPSKLSKIAMLLVPGVYDVRRGAAWRALATLVLLAVPLLSIVAQFVSKVPAVGMATAVSMANLRATFPLPSSAPDPMDEVWRTFLLAYPYAPLFLSLFAAFVLTGVALHLLRVPAVLALETRKRLDVVGVGKEVEQIELGQPPAGAEQP